MAEDTKDKEAKKEDSKTEEKKSESVGLSVGTMVMMTIFTFVACVGATFVTFQLIPPSINVEQIVKEQAEKPAHGAHLPVYPLGEFVVNLADPGGSRFLKTSITVKLYSVDPDAESHDEGGGGGHGGGGDPQHLAIEADLHNAMPAIKDLIISTLSRKTVDELSDYDAKLAVKEELVEEINHVLHGTYRIYDLYFTDFIIQ